MSREKQALMLADIRNKNKTNEDVLKALEKRGVEQFTKTELNTIYKEVYGFYMKGQNKNQVIFDAIIEGIEKLRVTT